MHNLQEVIWTSDDQQLLGSFDWKKSWLTNSDFLLETMAIIEETIDEGAIGIEYFRFVDDNRHNPDNKDVPSGGFYIDYHLEPLKGSQFTNFKKLNKI